MSEETKNDQLYTLPVTYVVDKLQESEEQLSVTKSLLEYFFEDQEKHSWLIPLAVEILWSNYAIVKTLKQDLDDPVYYDNPDTGEKEYMITESTLLGLQSFVVHRFYANRELNKFCFSTGLN